MISDIRSSITRTDCLALERAAHKLKGAVSVFDAKAVSGAAFELEQIGRLRATGDAQRTFARLEKQIATFKLALSEFEREICVQKS
jgi:HPt (histidine-containing phosphotransfer) domain-containing protein